ncbi:DNA-directed RNA polymerase subunit omega [Melissococcus plutonius]|uniref:DNA-directed RNA polymerase subunit omega n=2 Tax=Melissococcus plutonius TaxID=33970 RepID=F3Y8B2_MELPT|nr:DNA-directed RNA polymerase subunit omega [Melissococcus plutonius]BAL61527.1 DNA-directed RNA polymerase subunit omega [Melissococcus plutonius DAT561]AIM24457.1 DNA-directed RNA polymerase subunit omega [Melissococcus plutonius S1]KMT25869.1 DNA-directed RNA polymerase subunit omega [Melissococcus plutonius]KMT27214.1 DNA-directed RNA polymerase subunit omega [Melissococcus plutonius]KMT28315.1 DNA-directed RNA polymerase subunit omega [Melissococcus plutonius]
MMLKPSIDSLLKKVPSKYSLVILASKRAHELDEGMDPTLDSFESVKNVGRALEEINTGKLINDPHPEEKRERIQLAREEKKKIHEQEQKDLEEKISHENTIK